MVNALVFQPLTIIIKRSILNLQQPLIRLWIKQHSPSETLDAPCKEWNIGKMLKKGIERKQCILESVI